MFKIENAEAEKILNDADAEYDARFGKNWDEDKAVQPFLVDGVLTVDGAKRFAEWLKSVDEPFRHISFWIDSARDAMRRLPDPYSMHSGSRVTFVLMTGQRVVGKFTGFTSANDSESVETEWDILPDGQEFGTWYLDSEIERIEIHEK